jgi:uncharacterized membrane protein
MKLVDAPALGVTLFLAVVFQLLPLMRKRSLYFGVTVADSFRDSEEGCAIARQFRIWVWVGTAITLVVQYAAMELRQLLLLPLAVYLLLIVALAAWVRAWRRTRPHSVRQVGLRSAEIAAAPEASALGTMALVLPLLMPIGAAAWLWSRYAELPARYPVHWNGAGEVDRYVDKSLRAVFATPAIALVVLVMVLGVGLGIRYASRRGSSGEQAGWASKFRRLNMMMLTAIMWTVSAMTSTLSLAPLLPYRTIGTLMPAFVVALLATVVGFAIPLIRMSMKNTGGSDATPDECWSGGVIYYNPADPALMVEKREGIGYTLNFGNRLSWVILAFIVALPVVIIAMVSGLK